MRGNKVKVFKFGLQTYIEICVRKLIKCALVFSMLQFEQVIVEKRVLSSNLNNITYIFNVHIMHIHRYEDY